LRPEGHHCRPARGDPAERSARLGGPLPSVRLSAVRYPPQSGGQLMPVGVRPSPSRVKRQRGFLRDGLTCAVTPPGLRHRVAEPNPRLAASISRVGGSVLSDHHWGEPIAGLRQMARVARRVVVFQWDNAVIPRFGSCATTCRSSLRKHGSPVVRPARGSDQCRDGDRADPVGLRRRVLSRLLATPTRLPAGAGAPRHVGLGPCWSAGRATCGQSPHPRPGILRLARTKSRPARSRRS
jgi:hypothetical protein